MDGGKGEKRGKMLNKEERGWRRGLERLNGGEGKRLEAERGRRGNEGKEWIVEGREGRNWTVEAMKWGELRLVIRLEFITEFVFVFFF
jgi:hypothetical protein